MARSSAKIHGQYWNDQDEQISHELRSTWKNQRMDLDAFLACSADERGRRWRQFDHGAKFQLVALMMERRGENWMPETVEAWIVKYDSKWGSASADTDLTIPPTDEILAVVKDRHGDALRAEDVGGARQLDRVRVNLINGAKLAWHLGDLLIQSVNNPGQVYSVSARGCTCPNGAAGHSACWHVALYDILVDLQEERAATADHTADKAADRAEKIAELKQRIGAIRCAFYSTVKAEGA